jgi:glycosyltransferase involved in cell wall biosynthesis
MSKSPLVSVITVSKNSSGFIRHCIASIVDQQFKDFEYVVIDGGSTDGTQDIISEFSDRIGYWHSARDRGLTHAFNLGIEHSRGRWLLFINSDDFLSAPSVLSKVSIYLSSNPHADVIFGQVEVVSRDDCRKVVGGPYGQEFCWSDFLIMNTIPHQGAFINRDYFKRVGLYNEEFKLVADYELFLREGPALKARSVPVLVARMRDGGVSRRNQLRCIAEWHRARVSNNSASRWRLDLTYLYLIARAYVGQIYRKLLSRFVLFRHSC